MMIKNIIFDMGNVLIRFDRDAFLDRAGVTDTEDRALLMREVYLSLEWARMDRGSLTPVEAEKIMCTHLPERLHGYVTKLVSGWSRPILPLPGMSELVHELKENGYRLFLLSNAAYDQRKYWNEVPGSECFDGTLISCDVLHVKPEREIYECLLEKFSLRAEECVFIDDATNNAEGAFRCGITPIVFHGDALELRAKLASLGVKIETEPHC